MCLTVCLLYMLCLSDSTKQVVEKKEKKAKAGVDAAKVLVKIKSIFWVFCHWIK